MTDEIKPTPTGEHPATNLELKASEFTLSVRSLIQAGLALAVMVSTIFGAYFAIVSEARAQSDAGVSRVEPRIAELEARAGRNEVVAQHLEQHLFEVQTDVRELYKVIQTGNRSPRLEQPVPPIDSKLDGGK